LYPLPFITISEGQAKEQNVLFNHDKSSKIAGFGKQFIKLEQGAIAILTALILPALLGFGAIAYEIGYWYQSQQALQEKADIAAYAGAFEKSLRGDSGVTTRATYLASLNSFAASGGNTITVNNPPSSGSYTGDASAVEVLMTLPVSRSLTNYFSSSAVTAHARAVAAKTGGPACILALSGSAAGAVTFSGNAKLNAASCGVKVNSSDAAAFKTNGSTTLKTAFIDIAGGASLIGNPSIQTPSGQVKTGAPISNNPFSSLTIPSYSTCSFSGVNITGGGSVTLNPGTYCGGLKIASSVNVTMNPGTYIVDGGVFSIGGNANVTGNGVTVILSGQISGTYATAEFTGNGTLTLNAPTTGPYANIAIFQDPNAPSGGTNSIVGSSSQAISGALYFPNQELKFAGNTGGTSPCVLLVANTVNIVGDTNLQCNIGNLGGLVTSGTITLVE
jgi:Flp pilus assembly protein TadG